MSWNNTKNSHFFYSEVKNFTSECLENKMLQY